MKKSIKPQTKGRALNSVIGQLKRLTHEQQKQQGIAAERVAALVELCELVLIILIIIIIFAISTSGWSLYGLIICSMTVGSFITNVIWLVLLKTGTFDAGRRESVKKLERMSKRQAFNLVVGHLWRLTYAQKMEQRVLVERIAGLISLCELILIFVIFAFTIFGRIVQGAIICSLLLGSFLTNMVWLVLMRREIWT